MRGSSRTSRSPRPRCCLRRIASASRAARGHCPAARPPIYFGWLATWSAPRRRCGSLRPRATRGAAATTRVVAQIGSLPRAWDAVPSDLPHVRPVLVASAALQGRDLDAALPYLIGAAQSAASVIRDRFSPDAWRALTDLFELINAP